MPRPYCSTGEAWDREATIENSKEVWDVFRDRENGDIILWVYGPEDTAVELRMDPIGATHLAQTIMKGVNGDRNLYPRPRRYFL